MTIKHRKFIASLPCLITFSTNVQCAHIRRGNGGGMGKKPHDKFCVPLSIEEHKKQHAVGELKYWYPYGGYEKASVLAKHLYDVSGSKGLALQLITRWRNEVFFN